jgi:hypothetical protein
MASFVTANPTNVGSCRSGDSLELDICGTVPDCCTLHRTHSAIFNRRKEGLFSHKNDTNLAFFVTNTHVIEVCSHYGGGVIMDQSYFLQK